MLIDEDFIVAKQNTKGYLAYRGSITQEKRIRPWQREGFKSKKEWLYMKKRIKHLIWQKKM